MNSISASFTLCWLLTAGAAPAPGENPGDAQKIPDSSGRQPAGVPDSVAPVATSPTETSPSSASATASAGETTTLEPVTREPEHAPEKTVRATTPVDAVKEDKPPLMIGSPAGPNLTVGIQVFLRGQGRFNQDLGNTPDNHLGEVLARARIQALGNWGPLTGFVQVQDRRIWGFEASTISNEGNTDLHQGYLDLHGERPSTLSGSVRAGRQEIIWGRSRMIGNLTWLPGARSFNAVRLRGSYKMLSLDVFGALTGRAQTFTYTDDSVAPPEPVTVRTPGAQLVGGQFGLDAHQALKLEVIGLYDRAKQHPNNVTLDRYIGDVGGRVWGEPVKGFTYDLEGHGQFGQNNGLRHRAWAGAGTLAYTHAVGDFKPGIRGGVALASGHACTGPSGCAPMQSGDFFNFYPTNHIHYGLVDLMNWSNMRDFELGATFAAEPGGLKISATYHYFQLHEAAGRWTNAGGAQVGAGFDPSNTMNELGHEIDFVLVTKPWKPLMVQPGYGAFIPTGAGVTLGGDTPQHFLYLWVVFTM